MDILLLVSLESIFYLFIRKKLNARVHQFQRVRNGMGVDRKACCPF